jgi:hypothetical protein
VGQKTWEEVNDVVPGGNYGWPNVEGRGRSGRFLNPIYTYRHGDGPGQGRAVVGGVFYPMTGPFPEAYRGKYFVSEYVLGEIRVVDPATGAATPFASGFPPFELDLDIAPDGSLYYLGRGVTGVETGLWRIAFAVAQPPAIALAPTSRVASIGHPTTFTLGASGSLPLAFQCSATACRSPGPRPRPTPCRPSRRPTRGPLSGPRDQRLRHGDQPRGGPDDDDQPTPLPIIRSPRPGAAWRARPDDPIRWRGHRPRRMVSSPRRLHLAG